MSETLESEEKANWHPGEEGLLTKDEAHDKANLLMAKTGQYPRTPGVVHPTDREKILSEDYRNNAMFGQTYEADKKAEADFKASRGESTSIYDESKARGEDYQKALEEIDNLEAQAKEDLPAAKNTLRILKKGSRGAWHGFNVVFNTIFPSTNDVEELDYRAFKEKMKTAKEQLQDLENKAKRFEK